MSFQILTCVYLRMKLIKKLNCNLSEEEDSSRWSKILGLSYEDKNGLAEIEKFCEGNNE